MEFSFKIKRIFGGLKKKLFFNNNQIEKKTHCLLFSQDSVKFLNFLLHYTNRSL